MGSSNWVSQALCRKDDNPGYWVSYEIDKINYAKQICQKCTVRPECLFAALSEEDQFIGVRAGLSEIDFLMRTWQEVDDEQQNNWSRSDRVIQKLFREIA